MTKALKTQLKRTAQRAAIALAAGRVPGKRGRVCTVVGSRGGKNGARDAHQKARAAALKKGVRPKPAARMMVRPASAILRKPAAKSEKLDLLECFCYPDSGLSHQWALRRARGKGHVLSPHDAPKPSKRRLRSSGSIALSLVLIQLPSCTQGLLRCACGLPQGQRDERRQGTAGTGRWTCCDLVPAPQVHTRQSVRQASVDSCCTVRHSAC